MCIENKARSDRPEAEGRGMVAVSDPVHSDKDGWWFWTETWADREGPYADEKTARAHLSFYSHVLSFGPLGLPSALAVAPTPPAGEGVDLPSVEWPGKHDGWKRPRIGMIFDTPGCVEFGRAMTDAQIVDNWPDLNRARLTTPATGTDEALQSREKD